MARLRASLMHFHISRDVGADQPRPYGSLVICGVALDDAPLITRAIAGIARRQASQSQRSEQVALHHPDYTSLLLRRQHAMMQADRENLIQAYGRITMLTVDHIIETAGPRIPKLSIEA